MNFNTTPIIGIVGGMGPQAGICLLESITAQTKAACDQEHLSTILMSFPGHISDRTSFLMGRHMDNPGYEIAQVISKLAACGASIVGMACNTSYSEGIYDVVLNELERMNIHINLMHMPFETCKSIGRNHTSVRKVGLMTTNGTYISSVYKDILEKLGYEVIVPDYDFQDDVIHNLIYNENFGIKANSNQVTEEAQSLLNRALAFFKNQHADAIILGCTELSLILKEDFIEGMHVIDSTKVFAQSLINESKIITESVLNTPLIKDVPVMNFRN